MDSIYNSWFRLLQATWVVSHKYVWFLPKVRCPLCIRGRERSTAADASSRMRPHSIITSLLYSVQNQTIDMAVLVAASTITLRGTASRDITPLDRLDGTLSNVAFVAFVAFVPLKISYPSRFPAIGNGYHMFHKPAPIERIIPA